MFVAETPIVSHTIGTMDSSRTLQSWWWIKQGLDGSLRGAAPAAVLARSGWARSVAGVGPYLTVQSRSGLGREAVDAAVAALGIHELPGARGCTYVLPAEHFALGLTLGVVSSTAERNVARKMGVTDAEIDKLCIAVKKALRGGELAPDEIRGHVGSSCRSLGPNGLKKGISTTVPLALGALQASGDIRRVPVNGRLDRQRYKYKLWEPNPIVKPIPLNQAYIELAKLYFRWIGPATAAEFQWFSGLGVKAAKGAMEPLGLVAVDDDRYLHADELDAFRSTTVPKEPDFKLISSLDSLAAMLRNFPRLLAPEDNGREMIDEKGRRVAGGGLSDMPGNAIVDRGRIVGLWEYDQPKEELVYVSFIGKSKALELAVRETEKYIREDLGDARTFSLDSPKSRAPKIELLRKQAAL